MELIQWCGLRLTRRRNESGTTKLGSHSHFTAYRRRRQDLYRDFEGFVFPKFMERGFGRESLNNSAALNRPASKRNGTGMAARTVSMCNFRPLGRHIVNVCRRCKLLRTIRNACVCATAWIKRALLHLYGYFKFLPRFLATFPCNGRLKSVAVICFAPGADPLRWEPR